ncbi:unnamed protein product [Thelazia callipaeda]|uniref:Tyrosine-protein phosphatase domain-containing protein n=1 Tax=Thelazia callipaeda TaxID=103827 RepID=A0A0N5CQ49_THECL|nr:unnamed protein product [Thelazia callipaeda]
MNLLDRIVIFRGCEPSVIITYVAHIREVYLHAYNNLKKGNTAVQERNAKMLKQWKEIEKHFAKIKYAMRDCWPVGNEPDLLAAYVSIALLYSFYKVVCDESIIRQCYEAVIHARQCDHSNLSEIQLTEVLQYCDIIENIFLLRHQTPTRPVSEQKVHDAATWFGNTEHAETSARKQKSNLSRLPATYLYDRFEWKSRVRVQCVEDSAHFLAEYDRLSAVDDKVLNHKKLFPQESLLSNSELKSKEAKKMLECKEVATSLEGFHPSPLEATTSGGSEFLRPEKLKTYPNLQKLKSSSDISLFCVSAERSINSNLTASSPQLSGSHSAVDSKRDSNHIQKVTTDYFSPSVAYSPTCLTRDNFDEHYSDPFQNMIYTANSQKCAENEQQMLDTTPKLESFAKRFAEEIIHSVTKLSEESFGNYMRQNLETVEESTNVLTSTLLASESASDFKKKAMVVLNNDKEENTIEIDALSRTIPICTKRILKENSIQQVERVERVPETGHATYISADEPNEIEKERFGEQKKKVILVEGYTELALRDDYKTESELFHNPQQTKHQITRTRHSSNDSLTTVESGSITTIAFTGSANSCYKFSKDDKHETNRLEELSQKIDKMFKLFGNENENQMYIVLDHFADRKNEVTEKDVKFDQVEKFKRLDQSERQNLSATVAKISQKSNDELDLNNNVIDSVAVKFAIEQVKPKNKNDADLVQPKAVTRDQKEYIITERNLRDVREGKTVVSITCENFAEGTMDGSSKLTEACGNEQFTMTSCCVSDAQKNRECAETKMITNKAITKIYSDEFGSGINFEPLQSLNYTSDMPFSDISHQIGSKSQRMDSEIFPVLKLATHNLQNFSNENEYYLREEATLPVELSSQVQPIAVASIGLIEKEGTENTFDEGLKAVSNKKAENQVMLGRRGGPAQESLQTRRSNYAAANQNEQVFCCNFSLGEKNKQEWQVA